MALRVEKKLDAQVFKQYAKPIVHMRKQHKRSQFGIVLGAGVSKSFNIPDGKDLLTQIANHKRINGKKVDRENAPATARAEILYRRFAEQCRLDSEASGQKVDDHALQR